MAWLQHFWARWGERPSATAPAYAAAVAAQHGVDQHLHQLLDQADAAAPRAQRHLWLIHLIDWLRSREVPAAHRSAERALRMARLLDRLQQHPEHARRARAVLHSVLTGTDVGTLLADFGCAPRAGFGSELIERLRLRTLPGTPDTGDLGQLFLLLFPHEGDADWLAQIDLSTLHRLGQVLVDDHVRQHWQQAVLDAVQLLAAQVRASALSSGVRTRIDPEWLAARPFHHLVQATVQLADSPHPARQMDVVQTLRLELDACRQAAASVREHLDSHGVSVDVVFQISQLHERTERIDALLNCLISPTPAHEWQRLCVHWATGVQTRRSVGALVGHHYSMLARKVAERSAVTGEHYITRTRDEYRDMLHRAWGGGLVIAGTTYLKFFIAALGLSAFWGGFWAGTNYALSFVLVQLLHWTVATKQPAMTAPAMAAKLEHVGDSDAAIEDFVDEVTHLIRTQLVGIIGNLTLVVPVVLALQWLAWVWQGAPLVPEHTAHYVLKNLTLLGPTLAFAAFTGILLFLSSLIAGWWENWFVYHRLDSAIAWNPRITRVLGQARAQRWAAWWRDNISGIAANVSLGLMLGLVPALATFFGLPIEVRHVTLSAGQLAAALGTLGSDAVYEPAFWWCVAAVPLTGLLNVLVSFTLAFRLALRSRSLQVRERGRLYAALRRRLWQAPGSFVLPGR